MKAELGVPENQPIIVTMTEKEARVMHQITGTLGRKEIEEAIGRTAFNIDKAQCTNENFYRAIDELL